MIAHKDEAAAMAGLAVHGPDCLEQREVSAPEVMFAMPPNEPCPHCGQLILDWHNEWYEGAQRRAIYSGQAAMDCPLCREAVLWFESRDIAAPPVNAQAPVYHRSVILAAQWVPIREA